MVSKAMIQKWSRMLKHDSVLHVKQAEGKYYSVSEVAGYYNDFSGKVQSTKSFDENRIPLNTASHGEEKKQVYFPIAIFQYGLGAYDLWLETKKQEYYDAFIRMADWAVSNQDDVGAWNTFGVLHYSNPYSSMAQGEGASLLARAFKETKVELYRERCKKAVDFMLLSLEKGGTTDYSDGRMILKEYPEKPAVLNGWMFSGFGIFDCWKITHDENVMRAWKRTVEEIERELPKFDAPFWSYYDEGKKYASPFYHALHIELLRTYGKITESSAMKLYGDKWKMKEKSALGAKIAFCWKALQKLSEKKTNEWVFVE